MKNELTVDPAFSQFHEFCQLSNELDAALQMC
jgi:hypothetical protein